MKQNIVVLLSALYLTACGGSSGGGNSTEDLVAAANPPATTQTGTDQSSGNPSSVFTGGVEGNGGSDSGTSSGNGSVPTTLPPTTNGSGGSVDAQAAATISTLDGQITMFNDVDRSSAVNIAVRDSDISAVMSDNGEFDIELPISDLDRTVTLDITGDNVIPESIVVNVPANVSSVAVEADVSSRAPAMEFTLSAGGELENDDSATNVSVTVPGDAFMFLDGTFATGDADIQITEIDINDLDGDSAWAPNLIGMNEDTSETFALKSYGMSDFHFSKDGRKLQLRPGMTATIKTNLMSTDILTAGQIGPVPAQEGMVIPLWYYDTENMIWVEEGESVVVADAESPTGFSLVGEVSHFSTWNHDFPVPWSNLRVNVRTIDQFGNPYTGLTINSYYVTAKVLTVSGSGWSYESNSTHTRNMTPSNNRIRVDAPGQGSVTNSEFNQGRTEIRFTVSSVSATGDGIITNLPATETKVFSNNGGSSSVTIDLIVEVPIPNVDATVIIQPITEDGVVLSNVNVVSYTATAQSSGAGSTFSATKNMTPSNNVMTVEGNSQARINTNQTITTIMSVDNIVIEDVAAIEEHPDPISKVFKSFDNDHTVIFQVVVQPE